jgi:hypothetical protein
MIFERIRAFVRSSMEELEPERRAMKQALEELKIDAEHARERPRVWRVLRERSAGDAAELISMTYEPRYVV